MAKKKKNLKDFFNMEGTLVACKVADGLFKALDMSHCSDKWMLFIDSSKSIIKAFLLHNGIVLLVARAFGIKKVIIA
jgi:uncharacterized membrane-anchored protein